MLNAVVNNPEAKQFWATPGCLPAEIGIIIDQGQIYCFQGDEIKQHLQRGIHNIMVYSLIGLVADIDSGQHQKSHLVSLVNGSCFEDTPLLPVLTYVTVAHSRPTAPAESQWHLFNDFLVRPIKADEALTFNTSWKVPSVIAYQVKVASNRIDNSWKQNLDTSLLYMDHK
jgi:PAB-dependent poly(A)-specific ribonuclease subunit 2